MLVLAVLVLVDVLPRHGSAGLDARLMLALMLVSVLLGGGIGAHDGCDC